MKKLHTFDDSTFLRGSRAFFVIGLVTILLGIAHNVSAVILYPNELVAFATSGFAGLYDAPAKQIVPFWSVLFGTLIIANGYQIAWAAQRHYIISIVPGFFLLGVGLVGAWYVPFAPFWIAALLGIISIGLVIRRSSLLGTNK